MKNAIIVHGMPSKEEYFNPEGSQHNKHWLPWLKKQLSQHGITAETPDFPEPYDPDYEKWKSVFERYPINENTMLVGHSCGGGFLVRWLSENKIKVDKVALVAPWTDPDHDRAPKMFNDLQIDSGLRDRVSDIQLFISLDDHKEEQDVAEQLKQGIAGLKVQEFTDKGHFTLEEMGTEEFPELRNFLLQ
jgi:uncharacterized protein